MTDRELLELAAKAAGIEGEYGFASDDYYYRGNTEGILTYLPDGQLYVWNPLTDDGDALRLAVKLQMSLSLGPVRVQSCTIEGSLRGEFFQEDIVKHDHEVATRRAIVRAAAEIGKAMK